MKRAMLSVCAVAGLSGAAMGQDVIATLSYDDLSASFNRTTGLFSAQATAVAGRQSSGSTSRLVAPLGTDAEFQPGFVTQGTANFVLNLTVSQVGPDLVGSGSFTNTDADGDTIVGGISGTWASLGFGFWAFNGAFSNVNFNDNGAADGLFNGTATGSFGLNFGGSNFDGAITLLLENVPNFTSDFRNATTGTTGQITSTAAVPAPLAALTGGALLGAMAMRRRRR